MTSSTGIGTPSVAPSSAAYATITDFKAYTLDTIPTPPADAVIQRLLDNAARDVDWAAGAWPLVDTTTGAKFDPISLPAYQSLALNRATCAQAEYRSLQGEAFMAKAQHQAIGIATGDGTQFQRGTLPYIGPKVWRELETGGLLRRAQQGGVVSVSNAAGSLASFDQIGNL